MIPSESQRKEFLIRHLSNALFHKLSRGAWHYVTSGESPKFRIFGAGQAPLPPDGKHTFYTYAWLAAVSPSAPRLLFPMHALFLDSVVYDEYMGQFTKQTRQDWTRLLDSKSGRLYHLQDNTMRRNLEVPKLLCAVGLGLVERLSEMRLIVPIKGADAVEMRDSHQNQIVMAALRCRQP